MSAFISPDNPITPTLPLAKREYEIYPDHALFPKSVAVKTAQSRAQKDPLSPNVWIDLGRAYRQNNLHRESIEAYSTGLSYFAFNQALYRHRGHSYLNISRFYESIADLETALRLDPYDFDCYYLIGLAHFFLRDYASAEFAFDNALKYRHSIEDLISTVLWQWCTFSKLGKRDLAKNLLLLIPTGKVNVREGVYQIYRLLLSFQGMISIDELLNACPQKQDSFMLIAYGAACYLETIGQTSRSQEILAQILEAPPAKHYSFCYLAAVSEVKKQDGTPSHA